jgi:hypothetical protein
MAIESTISYSKACFDGIVLNIQRLISSIILNNYPKFKVYLVSKTCLLMSFKISSKVFYVVTCSKISGRWIIPPV